MKRANSAPKTFAEELAARIAASLEARQGAKLLFTIEEAAELLSIGKSSAYTLANKGEIPTVGIGSMRRVPVNLLLQYVETLSENARWTRRPKG